MNRKGPPHEATARLARNIANLLQPCFALTMLVLLPTMGYPLLFFVGDFFVDGFFAKVLPYFLLSLAAFLFAMFSLWRVYMLGRDWLREMASYLLGNTNTTIAVGEQLEKWIIHHIWATPVAALICLATMWKSVEESSSGGDAVGMVAYLAIFLTWRILVAFVFPPLLTIHAFVRNTNKALQGKPHNMRRLAMAVAICMGLMSLFFLTVCFSAPVFLWGTPLLVVWFIFGNFAIELAKTLNGPEAIS